MLSRRALLALIMLAGSGLGAVAADGATQFIPTSTALDMARIVVRAEGFDLSDKSQFYFDLLPATAGKPEQGKTVTVQFYWHDDLNQVIAIDEPSGWALDTWNCKVFDYPALRRYRTANAPIAAAVAALKAQSDCGKFTVERTPKMRPSARHR